MTSLSEVNSKVDPTSLTNHQQLKHFH